MKTIPKEVIKDLIREEKFSNTTEVMIAIKDMFRDVLQEIMEAELEAELGYEKQERRSGDAKSPMSKNYRNGYSKKTVKTQLGEVDFIYHFNPPTINIRIRDIYRCKERILFYKLSINANVA